MRFFSSLILALSAWAMLAVSPLRATDEAIPGDAQPYQSIAAKVGSDIITTFDVEAQVKMMEASMSPEEAASEEGKKKLADDHKQVLDRLVEEKLVVLAAKKGPDGYKDDGTAGANPYIPSNVEVEEELDKAFDQARNRFPNQQAFEDELQKERISLSEFRSQLRERMRDQMTFERMVKMKEQEFRPDLHVSDDEALAFYNDNKADFAVGAQVNLRHILFTSHAKAEAAVKTLKASAHLKDDFIAMAKKESQDELTASEGGRLGWIEKGGLRWSEVGAEAFKLKPGEMSGPIHSSDGWHVIYVEDAKSGEQKPFDEVKTQAKNAVYQQKVEKKIEAWVDDLKLQFFVEID